MKEANPEVERGARATRALPLLPRISRTEMPCHLVTMAAAHLFGGGIQNHTNPKTPSRMNRVPSQ
jgi:hypothetical protein